MTVHQLKPREHSVKWRVRSAGRKQNGEYRKREHLTETELEKLLAALKDNRHGHRDYLIGLVTFLHGLRVSELIDLRWDDIDFRAGTINIRRLKGSLSGTHYMERDEANGVRRLQREQDPKNRYIFINERGQPFSRFGINKMIEAAGEKAGISFPVHPHCLRHTTGTIQANKGTTAWQLQKLMGHASMTNTTKYVAMSPEPLKDIWRGKR